MNNRQNGRRRGRGGVRPQNGAPRPEGGSRIDNRARGNATQLHDKYKALARDAQMQGDRVLTEYYFQFADHYFRILMEQRPRFEEGQQRPQSNGRYDMAEGMEGDEGSPDEIFAGEEPRQDYRQDGRRDEPRRDDGRREDARRDVPRREDGRRDDTRREEGRRDDGRREERNGNRQDYRRDGVRQDDRGDRNADRAPAPVSAEQPVSAPPVADLPVAASQEDEPRLPLAVAPGSEEGEPVRRRRGRPRRVDTAVQAEAGVPAEEHRIEADRLPPPVNAEAAPANDVAEEAPRRRGRPRRPRPDAAEAVAEA